MTKRTEQTRSLFASLLEQSQKGVIVVDAGLRIVHINRRAETGLGAAGNSLGRELPEVLGSIWSIDDLSGIIDRIRDTLETDESGATFDVTARRRKTDELEHYEWQLGHVLLPVGGRGVACSFAEISQRRRDEAIAMRHARWQAFLADISSQLLLTKRPQSLLADVFGRLAEELGLEVHLAFAAEPNGDRLRLTSATGLPSGLVTAVQVLLLAPDSVSPLPDLRSEFVIEGIDEQPEQPQFIWLRSTSAKWCIGIPLQAGSQLFGALVMISLSRRRFDVAEIQLIRPVCQLASVSVDRASLLEETRRAKDVAETANRAKDEFLVVVFYEFRTPLNPALLIASENAADVSLNPGIRDDF
ncbi:MAG TPA: PAS domain-containing protein, partial [Opitutus sp.]|nr:PAS domain-containing protein [Opitutus sp.]